MGLANPNPNPNPEPNPEPNLEDGTRVQADAVVLATEAPAAAALLATRADAPPPPTLRRGLSSCCLYFGFAGAPPVAEPLLLLNARAGGQYPHAG